MVAAFAIADLLMAQEGAGLVPTLRNAVNPVLPPAQAAEGPSSDNPDFSNWKSYQFRNGGVHFSFPTTWNVEDATPTAVALRNNADQWQLLLVGNTSVVYPDEPEELQVSRLEHAYRKMSSERYEIDFTGSGRLSSPQQPVYVVGKRLDTAAGSTSGLLVTYATDGRRTALIVFQYTGSAEVPEDIVPMLGEMVQSFRFLNVQGQAGQSA